MKKASAFIIILFIISGISFAGFETGNSLLLRLRSPDPGSEMLAVGYIIGVGDAFDGFLWSSPQGVIYGQIADVVEKYLEEHPENRHEAAVNLIINALEAAFPRKQDSQ